MLDVALCSSTGWHGRLLEFSLTSPEFEFENHECLLCPPLPLYRDGEPAFRKHNTLITATACAPGSCRNEGLRSRTRVAYLVENTRRHYYCRYGVTESQFILKLRRNTRYLQSIRGMIIKDDSPSYKLIGECLNTETQNMPVTDV
ncbi:hypothetical protein HYALB_00005710 [Hymenoscyphus albidus]|uniref:Uncharacterized protein n=1 Tax=Hymenoscyphus albidus TaxID=595503 RepID=A0A9N9Q5W6_9HELO|nr:hypothetical protein HYALB_00005710 [Hymenoscyphus albidus]